MFATSVLQETFLDNLLSAHELTEDIYKMYIGTVRTNVWRLLPSTVVSKLQPLFDAPTGKHLLTIPDHAEVREFVCLLRALLQYCFHFVFAFSVCDHFCQ